MMLFKKVLDHASFQNLELVQNLELKQILGDLDCERFGLRKIWILQDLDRARFLLCKFWIMQDLY